MFAQCNGDQVLPTQKQSGPRSLIDSSYNCSSNSGFCSIWAYCDEGECRCGQTPQDFLTCSRRKLVSLADCTCITYNEKGLMEGGKCIYTCGDQSFEKSEELNKIPLSDINENMCGSFNRTGTLCGKCKDDHYPLAYSFDT